MLMEQIKIISLLVLFCLVISVIPMTRAEESTKEWTFMFYDDADFYMAADPLDVISRNMRSSSHVNILVLQDKEHAPVKLWYIDSNHNKILIDEWGELNMGNYTTLKSFITYCKSNYPANRYMLILYDHGLAWKGACIDVTSGNDFLTMKEIRRALSESGGVNIIGFCGCLMGCIESAYELRNYVEVYIGSEEMNGYIAWPFGRISFILNNYYNAPTYTIANKIIDAFKTKNPRFGTFRYMLLRLISIEAYLIRYHRIPLFLLYPPHVTISAIRTDKLDALIRAVDNLSIELVNNYTKYRLFIDRARSKAEDYPIPMRLFPPAIKGHQVDLYDFVNRLNKLSLRIMTGNLQPIIRNVKQCIREVVIAEHHQIGHTRSHGVSIFFPYKKSSNPYYDVINEYQRYCDSGLDFVNDTHWDEFLQLYLQ